MTLLTDQTHSYEEWLCSLSDEEYERYIEARVRKMRTTREAPIKFTPRNR